MLCRVGFLNYITLVDEHQAKVNCELELQIQPLRWKD